MTSVPAFTSVKSDLKFLSSVSPITSVPERKATPRNTDTNMPNSRRLCANREANTTFVMAQSPRVRMRSRMASALGAASSSTMRPSPRNSTESAYVAAARVVGDHHDRLAHLARGGLQELEQLRPAARVEVAGRFVGEHDVGPAHQRARHRDALLLPAGELRRSVPQPVAQPDGVDHRVDPFLVRRLPGQRRSAA